MLKQYDPQTARQSILKRTPPDEFPISQRVLDGIKNLFGESLSAEQAVTKILKDVRTRGDAALQDWTKRLDSIDLKPAPISKDMIQAALDSITPAQRDALEKAAAREFNLVLTDQNMPRLDGISLTKQLRQDPRFRTTPILILTTESSDQMKQAGRAAGATGWLVKPFDPNKLIEVIGKVMR